MMIAWEDLTEAQKDEANEAAWADAAEAVRDVYRAHPDVDVDEDWARHRAYDAIEGRVAAERRTIKRAQRTRATKMDREHAVSAQARIRHYGLILGFIWDVEV